MDNNFKFVIGDIDEAVSIMRQASKRLIDSGKKMRDLQDLSFEKIGRPKDEYIVMYNSFEGAARAILSFEDKDFWHEIPINTSGFIHKLSVRRKYAKSGAAQKLMEYAEQICKNKGISALRLDCGPHRKSLVKFYEDMGLKLQNVKAISYKSKVIDTALYAKLWAMGIRNG
ncbi:MAG: GNAT family N-acetyltransferase [Endomicrobium sp.]|nr:GNAT family N-acetyltransferase [Endomicrobium sp.]